MKNLLLSMGLILASLLGLNAQDFSPQRIEMMVKAGSPATSFRMMIPKGTAVKVLWADGQEETLSNNYSEFISASHNYASPLTEDAKVLIEATELIGFEESFKDASLVGFGIINAPKLTKFSFNCFRTTLKKSLNGKVDFTNCPLLEDLVLGNAPGITLPTDLSHLKSIKISSDYKKDSDIYAAMQVDMLNLSGATNLQQLSSMNQNIRQLDVTNCNKLANIAVSNCGIEELIGLKDLSKKNTLKSIDVSYNKIGIHQLPLLNPNAEVTKYNIKQFDYQIPSEKVNKNKVDLSLIAEVSDFNGNMQKTTFVVKKGYTKLDPSNYTEENGIFTFKESAFTNSITNEEVEQIEVSFEFETPVFANSQLASYGPPKTSKVTITKPTSSSTKQVTFTTTFKGEEIFCNLIANGNIELEGMTAVSGQEDTYLINESNVTLKGDFTNINLGNAGLTSIQFEGQENLEAFLCFDNKLTELDLSTAPNLIELNCSTNELQRINLSKNTKLKVLYAYTNTALQNLDVSNSPLLEELYASGCGITSIDLTNCSKLERLDLFKNKELQSITLANHPNLVTLLAGNNKLTQLNLDGCKKLNSLFIQNNQIRDLNLDGFHFLTTLEANNNMLTGIIIRDCPKLKSIKLFNNQLTTLDLSSLPELSSLDIVNNKIASLIIDNNNKLNYISMFNNQLNGSAMDQFVANIGNAYNPDANPYIDIIDTTLATEGNTCTAPNNKDLIAKKWHVFDFQGEWSKRTELTGEGNTTDIISPAKAYIAGETLVIQNLNENGAILYNCEGKKVMDIQHSQTNIAQLPNGIYLLLINGNEAVKIAK